MAFEIHPHSFQGFAESIILSAHGGVATDDMEMETRLVITWMRELYATVMDEDIRKAEAEQLDPDPTWFTNFPCVKLEDLDYTGCDCSAHNCSIKRVRLPKDIASFYNKPMIGYLGLTGFVKQFEKVDSSDPLAFLRSTGGRFGLKGMNGGYFVVGEDIMVVLPASMKSIKQLAMSAATYDPTQDKITVDGSVIKCSDFEELPYPENYFARIREKMQGWVRGEIQLTAIQDKTNNADGR